MGTDLNDILTQLDCPTCGARITVSYHQLRLYKAAACKCGNLFRLSDDTRLAAVQGLIDETNPLKADND